MRVVEVVVALQWAAVGVAWAAHVRSSDPNAINNNPMFDPGTLPNIPFGNPVEVRA